MVTKWPLVIGELLDTRKWIEEPFRCCCSSIVTQVRWSPFEPSLSRSVSLETVPLCTYCRGKLPPPWYLRFGVSLATYCVVHTRASVDEGNHLPFTCFIVQNHRPASVVCEKATRQKSGKRCHARRLLDAVHLCFKRPHWELGAEYP